MRLSRLYLGLFATLGFALLLAQSLNNLAPLYTETDDYATAEPLYERALAIREKELGPEHPDIGTSLKDLALLYQAKGEYAKAEPLLQRALAISEKYLGPEHPNTAICVIAEGARIFDGFDTSRMQLELISTRRYASGVVEVSYRPRWL
jgi:tetratricopeptide (TPR) repeat protein